jgi:RNA polymerase sigma factor (sigma-70 family)
MAPPAADQHERSEHLAIAERDGEVFARWLARCEEALRLSLRAYARDVDVEGIVQEAALRVWQHAPEIRHDGRRECLLRWAVTVARNLARDQLRRLGREARLEDDDDPPDPSTAKPADPLLQQRIRQCRDKLPAKPALALDTRVENGGTVSDRQLAPLAGMTYDAFRQNLTRARRLLENCLRGYGIDVRSLLS